MTIALLALADMRPQIAAAAVVLVLGVTLIGSLQSPAAPSRDRIGIPVVAFLCGPMTAILWFAADVFWISPESYLYLSDYLETLLPVVVIGLAGGSVGAAAFLAGLWIGARRRC